MSLRWSVTRMWLLIWMTWAHARLLLISLVPCACHCIHNWTTSITVVWSFPCRLWLLLMRLHWLDSLRWYWGGLPGTWCLGSHTATHPLLDTLLTLSLGRRCWSHKLLLLRLRLNRGIDGMHVARIVIGLVIWNVFLNHLLRSLCLLPLCHACILS